MRSNLRKYLSVATVAVVMTFVIPAVAQDGWWQGDRRDRNPQAYGNNSDAYQDGYRDAVRDVQRRGAPHPDNRRWRDDSDRQSYQAGYQAGYQQAMAAAQQNRGYGGYGNGPYDRDHDWNRNRGYGQAGQYGNPGYGGTQLAQVAQQSGYTDGAFYAQRDQQRGAGPNPTEAKGYRDADHNYSSSLGSKDEFQQIYRQAFIQGYNNAYRGGFGQRGQYGYPGRGGYGQAGQYGNPGYGNYGGFGGSQLAQVAQQSGYTDGAFYAQRDRQSGKRPNPTDAKGYKDADHNYSSSLGSKDEFKQVYRQAFIQGYNNAYR
jgi:hypothetical protein